MGKGGNIIEYWPYMERTYGREVVDMLISDSRKTVKYKEYDYLAIAAKYTAATELLLADFSHKLDH